MNIYRETILSLPEPFYELLERQLAALNNPSLNIVTLNHRDPDYSAERGGYHPVEINLYRQGDCWYLNYFTDFAYCGGPFPELEKEMEVLFQEKLVYNSFFGRCYLEHADNLVRLLLENFCNYIEMAVYQVQVNAD
ncbi:DUF2787 domain-containing protein [Shewanella oncorhynchi]|uniref:DUF2787 domain-containing protein n=1 Tax=Shewanella oncorhynchi TaxID=2726434 RepID=UPI002E7C30F8|nr:DUF2787 domain-containing protein [Shewanella oncorhynchi]WVI91541.1 DUF2787 domain-containing protein [Shewanella oncorhynchi]